MILVILVNLYEIFIYYIQKIHRGLKKVSVIEMWFIRPNFEKLRRNLRKGILKGIYWILTGLRVDILYEFCVVLLRDLFYYTTSGDPWAHAKRPTTKSRKGARSATITKKNIILASEI